MKILNFYIIKLFLSKFIKVFAFAGILYYLLENIITNNVDILNLLQNFVEFFQFVFFVSSLWTLISVYKTREMIAFSVFSISQIKISLLFSFVTVLFSIFYIFFYDHILLNFVDKSKLEQNAIFNEFTVYSKVDKCNYQLIILNKLHYNSNKNTFTFENGDLISFKDCLFNSYNKLNKDTIVKTNTGITFIKQKLTIKYDFDALVRYFIENTNKNNFNSLIDNVKLILQFAKNNINYSKLLLLTCKSLNSILFFIAFTLLPFVFFANVPPRQSLLKRTMIAFFFMLVIYLTNLFLTNIVNQIDIINPFVLLIIPSFIISFIYFIMLLQK